jgi:hypothetical protein
MRGDRLGIGRHATGSLNAIGLRIGVISPGKHQTLLGAEFILQKIFCDTKYDCMTLGMTRRISYANWTFSSWRTSIVPHDLLN